MKSEDVDQIKGPLRLSPFATVVVLFGCVAILWSASHIIRFPKETLSYMMIFGGFIFPMTIIVSAFLFPWKKRSS